GVHHRRRGRDRARLADALDAERVGGGRCLGPVGREVRQVGGGGNQVVGQGGGQQVAVIVVDGLLVQRLRDALGQAAVHLARDEERVHDLAHVVDGTIR